jgi:hypothetical protein
VAAGVLEDELELEELPQPATASTTSASSGSVARRKRADVAAVHLVTV